MAEKRVSVRLAAVGGKQVRAELDGVGGAATRGFRYAGPVRFAGWDGEAPITVQWDISQPVPKYLQSLYGLEQ